MDTPEAEVGGISLKKLTATYIKIRDKRSELKAEFDAADGVLEKHQDEIKRALLEYCREQGVDSARTDAGLIYRQTKRRYWTNDWESMHKFIMEHGVPEFLEKRLNQGAVKQFLEENPDVLPPGLNTDSEYVITVRKK